VSRYRKVPCRHCGKYVTTNALGRSSHLKACPGAPQRVTPSTGAAALPPRGCFHMFYSESCEHCRAYRAARNDQLKETT
jgi:hypothetical protein